MLIQANTSIRGIRVPSEDVRVHTGPIFIKNDSPYCNLGFKGMTKHQERPYIIHRTHIRFTLALLKIALSQKQD